MDTAVALMGSDPLESIGKTSHLLTAIYLFATERLDACMSSKLLSSPKAHNKYVYVCATTGVISRITVNAQLAVSHNLPGDSNFMNKINCQLSFVER